MSNVFDAAYEGDLQKLINLVENGADISAKNNCDETPCHYACCNAHLHILQWLQEKGADINAKNILGGTPCHEASCKGHVDVLQWLHEKGADINVKDNDGRTPCHKAASNTKLGSLQLLHEKGADINAKDNSGETPCHMAAYEGDLEILQWLHGQGADISAKDNKGNTPSDKADDTTDRGTRVLKWLERKTNVIAAADAGDLQAVVDIVEGGADINAKDKLWERTACHKASSRGHLEVLQWLQENGADLNAKDEDDETPCHKAACEGHLHVLQLLQEKGADINAKDDSGATPCHAASCYGHLEVLRLLHGKGADINAKDNDGGTPCHKASRYGYLDVLQWLHEKGADINAKNNDGETPRQLAEDNEVVQWLEINAKDNDGDAVPEDAIKGSTATAPKIEDLIPAIMEGMLEKFVSGTGVWLQPLTFPNPEKKFHYYMMVKPKGPDVLCLRHGADAIITESLETEALRNELLATAQSNGVKVNSDHKDFKNIEDDRVRALFTTALADAVPKVDPKEANDALLAACRKTRPVLEDIKAAISAGAEVNKEHDYGKTGLHWAASTDSGAVEVLLAAGADPKLVTWTGQNALHIAHMYGAMSNVKLLLEAGVDPEAVDSKGRKYTDLSENNI